MTATHLRWGWAFGLLLVGLAAVGCANRPRHGFILRGNWALEFNRVPWIVTRVHEDADQATTATSCDVEQTTCETPAPTRDVSCSSCDGSGCETCGTRINCGGCGHRWLIGPRQCRLGTAECPQCRREVRRPLLSGLWRRKPPEPVHHEVPYSRFHPVPTHPVFSNEEAPQGPQPSAAPPEATASPESGPAAVPTPAPAAPTTISPPEPIPPGPSVETPPPKAKSDASSSKAKPKGRWQTQSPGSTPVPAPPADGIPAKTPKASESSADWLFRHTMPPDAPMPAAGGTWQLTTTAQAG